MNKKIVISIIILVLVLAGAGLYFFLTSEGEQKPNEEKGFFSFLFPTGEDKPTPSFPENGEDFPLTPGESTTTPQTQSELIQLVSKPVSGATFDEKNQKIRYVLKSTGHLYEINPDKSEEKQITITTIPKIFEIFWGKNGTGAVLKYIDDSDDTDIIRVFTASFSTTTEGSFLPSNTTAIALSPSMDQIFYLIKNGDSKGITASLKNTGQKEIFSTPLTELIVDWPQKNTITLLTRPSAKTDGYFYKINSTTGALTKIIGEINGLTALHSPLNNKIIYSESNGNSFSSKIFDYSENKYFSLGITTLPEKCFFSKLNKDIIYCATPNYLPTGEYPDDWYKGIISFSDSIWKINLSDGSTKQILNKENLDIIKIFSSEEENHLFFQNKKDSSLWSLKLQ